MRRGAFLGCIFLVCAGVALAHSGVKNPAVMERMMAMSGISENTKVIGDMAKGKSLFDQAAARSAAAAIALHAQKTPDLFADFQTDPKSEAKQAIWDNFDDFTAKSMAMKDVASGLATSITGPNDLAPAMAALGETCTACHKAYRE